MVIDYSGKRVVVIGSGATAVTLVPALCDRAAQVTMLQRSPSYVASIPGEDRIANALRRALPSTMAYVLTRWKNVLYTVWVFTMARRRPKQVRDFLIGEIRKVLGPDYDVDRHFSPDYKVWDQRLCMIPDGDLFSAIKSGRASIVTDRIDTFTETGIRLVSGDEIEADLVVSAHQPERQVEQ